jgi:hypothetical protein
MGHLVVVAVHQLMEAPEVTELPQQVVQAGRAKQGRLLHLALV